MTEFEVEHAAMLKVQAEFKRAKLAGEHARVTDIKTMMNVYFYPMSKIAKRLGL